MKFHKFFLVFLSLILLLPVPVFAHSGRTDGAGGHYNHSTGEYHYHHGYPAHQHPNGICPYEDEDKTDYSNNTNNIAGTDKNSKDQNWLVFILVGIGSFAVGIFAFCQIIGVIGTRHYRLKRMIVFTIIIWTVILAFTVLIIYAWFYNYRIAFYIAMIISLFLSRNAGKIDPEEAANLAVKTDNARNKKLKKNMHLQTCHKNQSLNKDERIIQIIGIVCISLSICLFVFLILLFL